MVAISIGSDSTDTATSVYAPFFQLREMPFSISPDPAYLYMSPRHQEALGHLLYGTGQYGGFVQLTGEVGTGKTTIVRALLEQKLEGVEVAMVHNPRQSEAEFVQTICDELSVDYRRDPPPTVKNLVDELNLHLLRNHANDRRTVLIIDEAQNLAPDVLEQVRLLTNLETNKDKLLRIMLVGQPELAELLARPDLRQLASRITARYHLTPLEESETGAYIRHRLRVAGTSESLFTPDAVVAIQRLTRGVPRLINLICDRALLGAYSRHQRRVTRDLVRGAAVEVFGKGVRMRSQGDARHAPWRRLPGRRRSLSLPDKPLALGTGAVVGLAALACLVLAIVFRDRLSIDTWLGRSADQNPVEPASAPVRIDPPAQTPSKTSAEALKSAPANPADGKALNSFAEVIAGTPALPKLTDRLIRLWDSEFTVPNGENVCRSLHTVQLECYRTQGSVDLLRRLDRPAILTLELEDGTQRHVLLTQLTSDRASLAMAAGSTEVSLVALDEAWTGEMFLLWRLETADVAIEFGERGPGAEWLRERLARLMGKTVPAKKLPFDDALRAEVRQFQAARGLGADGIVGVQTRIALSDLAPGTPTLKYTP
ncbi:MAG: AAA family ATPase [Panacagrimonas sp.]